MYAVLPTPNVRLDEAFCEGPTAPDEEPRAGQARHMQPMDRRCSMRVSPHVVVPDAGMASEWYGKAFGARERNRIPLPDRKVLSVEIEIGETVVHLGSEFPAYGIVSPLTIGGTATVLQIETDDADALWARALAAGAKPHHPLTDQFWGERHGQLVDPFGHRWNVAQKIRDVSRDEIVAAAAKAFAS
jgi:PhnB protein